MKKKFLAIFMGLFISSSCFFANAAEKNYYVMQFIYKNTGMKENAYKLLTQAAQAAKGKEVEDGLLTKDNTANVNHSINFYCIIKNLFTKINCWDEDIKKELLSQLTEKLQGFAYFDISDDLKKKIEDVLKNEKDYDYKKINISEADLASAKEEIFAYIEKSIKQNENYKNNYKNVIGDINSFKDYKKKELQQRIENVKNFKNNNLADNEAEKDQRIKDLEKRIKDLDDEKKLNELYEKDQEEIQIYIKSYDDLIKFYKEIIGKIKSIELKNVEGLNQNLEINSEFVKANV